MRHSLLLAVIVLLSIVTPASADEDYVLYSRAGGAFSGFVPSHTHAWAAFTAQLQLNLEEQLAFRDAQLAWLRSDLNQAEPTKEAKLASHIAIVDRFIKQLDETSRTAFRQWVTDPKTVYLSPGFANRPVSPEYKYLLVEFRKTLLGWSAV